MTHFMSTMPRFAIVVLTLSSVVATGCIDLEHNLQLDRNLSGKAAFAMKFDLEGMVQMMAMLKRGMEGKEGMPTAAEIEAIKQEMLSSGKMTTRGDFEKDRAELEKSLPAGVKLLGASFQEDGLKIGANLSFSFDHVSKLAEINLPGKKSEGGPGQNPVDAPFGGLQVLDEGASLLITSPVENPAGEQQSQMPPAADPETMKQVEQLLKGLRVAFKISAPFDVLEHNAHRKEGTTLVWEYDLKSLQKMTPSQLKSGVRVRYRK
jgi:hypothetical protein